MIKTIFWLFWFITYINNVLTVLILNLKSAWPTKISVLFLDKMLKDTYIIFQKGVDNFEIEHKTCNFLVIGVVPLNCDMINESNVGNVQFLFFTISYLSISNATFWSKTHHNCTSDCRDMGNSLHFLNNIKYRNLSPLSAYNTKSIYATSESFPWLCHSFAR